MAIASNKFLGALAIKLDLHTHLQHFSNPLTNQITQYAEETKAIIQNNSSVDFWLLTGDPPKVGRRRTVYCLCRLVAVITNS